jgi:hypothetical protein
VYERSLYLESLSLSRCQPIAPIYITPSNGYLGSRTDEERSELRDVMRIADVRESSNL